MFLLHIFGSCISQSRLRLWDLRHQIQASYRALISSPIKIWPCLGSTSTNNLEAISSDWLRASKPSNYENCDVLWNVPGRLSLYQISLLYDNLLPYEIMTDHHGLKTAACRRRCIIGQRRRNGVVQKPFPLARRWPTRSNLRGTCDGNPNTFNLWHGFHCSSDKKVLKNQNDQLRRTSL